MLIVLEENLSIKKDSEENSVSFIRNSTGKAQCKFVYDGEENIVRYEDEIGNFYDSNLMAFPNPFNFNFDYGSIRYSSTDFAYASDPYAKYADFTFSEDGPTFHNLYHLKKKERKKVILFIDNTFYRIKKYKTHTNCDFDGCEMWASVKAEKIF